MSSRLRRRLEAAARRAGMHGPDHYIVVVWDGVREDPWRERVAEARKRGWRVKIVRFALSLVAGSPDEAEDLVQRHRAEGHGIPVSVHDRGDFNRLLAEWEPPLPDWLEDAPAPI